MASYAENGVSSENRFASSVDNFPRDLTSTPSKILGHMTTSDICADSTSSQNANISNLTNGPILNNYQHDKNKHIGLDKYQSPSVDAPSGYSREASSLFMDCGSLAEISEGSFNSWKKCSDDLQQRRFYVENGTPGNPILGPMRSDEYVYMQPSDASINSVINRPNYSEGLSSASWCHPTVWPDDPNLVASGDRNCLEWSKTFQDQFSDVNPLFSERCWRTRTASDNGTVANKSSHPSTNRSEAQHHHRRKGRTTSGSSNNPTTDASPNSDESHAVNLPAGQNVNTSDFDTPSCLAESVARLSMVSELSGPVGQRPPVMSIANSSDLMNQFILGAQASLANIMEKSQFFPNNSNPGYLPADASNQSAFGQNLHPYHHQQRPSTSDQYTQHDTLAGAFRGYPGATASTYNFDHLHQEDEYIWFYQDPNGRIQGGFSSEQMASWFSVGRYFTPQLMIRRKCDDTLSTLQSYIDIYAGVPFISKVRVPPIKGGITPALITFFRNSQNPSPLLSQMEKDPIYQKLLADTGFSLLEGFGKNGMSTGITPQPTLIQTVAKLLEMAAPSLNFNDSISLLSEFISKGRIDPYTSQEVKSSIDAPWPTPLQSQILTQVQEFIQRQHSTNDFPQSACTSNGALNGDTSAISVDSDGTMRNSSSAVGEQKSNSNRSPQQQPIGSKSGITTDSCAKSSLQQQGWSRVTTGEQVDQTAITKQPAGKNCWTEGGAAVIIKAAAANGCAQQSTPVKSQSTPLVTPQKPVSSSVQNGMADAGNGKKKNKQTKQNSPVQPNGNTKRSESGKKATKGGNDVSRTPEMESLIQWTEQNVKGIPMMMSVDIPTLVECLVMIDGPFEVQRLILEQFENTPRTELFVRNFLDRRHTCWQQYKKQKEEEENNKKNQKSSETTEAGEYSGATKFYQENTDLENAWRQIKPKGGNGRRGKKGAKNR